jgi:hypothetical protein
MEKMTAAGSSHLPTKKRPKWVWRLDVPGSHHGPPDERELHQVRYALAIAVIAVTLAAGVYVHQRHTFGGFAGSGCNSYFSDSNCVSISVHPTWEDPVAVLIAIGGVAVAVGIIATRRSAGAG